MRQLKREVKIGNVTIGGKNPVAVQTMLNVPVEDIEGNVAQAKRCEAAGCQILRVTCPSPADAKCIEAVKNAVNIPIVADIHFDYKAALACADVGVDKIRINPGNIGGEDRVKAVVDACRKHKVPIRIGVNGGSLEKKLLAKYDELVSFPLYKAEGFKKHYIDSVMADSVGYAGTEIIRRVVGDSKVMEVTSVTDLEKRIPMERALIKLGIALIMRRSEFVSGAEIIEAFRLIIA